MYMSYYVTFTHLHVAVGFEPASFVYTDSTYVGDVTDVILVYGSLWK